MITRTLLIVAALSLPISAQTRQPDPGRVTGHLKDAAGAAVGGATVVLSTPEGQTVGITIATSSGDYSFAATPPGNYVVQAFAVGFGPSRLITVRLDPGKDLKQEMTMDIGFVRNTPTATALTAARASSAPTVVDTNGVRRVRVGGNVATGNLVRQSPPVYPTDAKDARIQGMVVLETVIGIDGKVLDAKPLSGPPELLQAAVDSVKTWRYKPVVMNGAAMEVVTTVTVNFSIK